eukprot:2882896-Amphidinium_carterae.1
MEDEPTSLPPHTMSVISYQFAGMQRIILVNYEHLQRKVGEMEAGEAVKYVQCLTKELAADLEVIMFTVSPGMVFHVPPATIVIYMP